MLKTLQEIELRYKNLKKRLEDREASNKAPFGNAINLAFLI